MGRTLQRALTGIAALALAGTSGSALPAPAGPAASVTARTPPVSLHITRSSGDSVQAEYRLARPTRALHFAPPARWLSRAGLEEPSG